MRESLEHCEWWRTLLRIGALYLYEEKKMQAALPRQRSADGEVGGTSKRK